MQLGSASKFKPSKEILNKTRNFMGKYIRINKVPQWIIPGNQHGPLQDTFE